MLMFLNLNNTSLEYEDDELVTTILSICSDAHSQDRISRLPINNIQILFTRYIKYEINLI